MVVRRRRGSLTPSRAKERRAYDLWVRGATPAQIAQTVFEGAPMYGSEGGAREAIERAASYMAPLGETELVRDQMLASLMADLVECNRIMGRRHPVLGRDGQPVRVPVVQPDGSSQLEALDDDDVRIRTMAQKGRIWDQIARLQGVYAAAKFEFAGKDGGPIELEDRRARLLERSQRIRLLPVSGPGDTDGVVVDAESTDVKEA